MASGTAAKLEMLLTARDHTGPGMNSAARHAKKLERSLDRLKSSMRVAGAAAAVAAGYFAVDSVKAYAQAEAAQNKLQDSYARFPKLHNVTLQSLRDLNSELQRKTRFDDDDLAAMQAKVAQFNLTGKQLQTVTPLIADYAAKTGQDVVTAGGKFGKALLGNTRALKELGISYKSTGDQAKDYDAIVAQLRKKVGGFATREASTAAVKLAILKNQYGELKEAVGAALLPVLTQLTDAMVANMPAIQATITRNLPAIKSAFEGVGSVIRTVGSVVGTAYKAFASLPPGVQDAALTITGLATALGLLSKSAPGRGIKVAVDVLGGGFKALKSMSVAAGVVNVTGAVSGGPGGTVPAGKPGGKPAPAPAPGPVGKGGSLLGKAGKGAGWLLGGYTAAQGITSIPWLGPLAAGAAMSGGFAAGNAYYNSGGRKNNLVASPVTGQLMFQKPYPSKGGRLDGAVRNRAADAAAQAAALQKVTAQQNQYNIALTRSKAAANAANAGVRANTATVRQNRMALLAQGNQARLLLGTYRESGASAAQLAAKQKRLGAAFIRNAVDMGMPRKQAVALARSYGLLPKRKSTKVDAPGSKPTQNALDRLKATRLGNKATRVSAPGADPVQGQLNRIRSTKLPSKKFNVSSNVGSVAQGVQNLINKIRALPGKIAGQLGFNVATGGPIFGPGTSTSDSIPANLSNGEFVMQARAVRRYGLGFMAAVNAGRYAPVRGYAKGGPFSSLRTKYGREGEAEAQAMLDAWLFQHREPQLPKRGVKNYSKVLKQKQAERKEWLRQKNAAQRMILTDYGKFADGAGVGATSAALSFSNWLWLNPNPGKPQAGKTFKADQKKYNAWLAKYRTQRMKAIRAQQDQQDKAVSPYRDAASSSFNDLQSFAGLAGLGENIQGLQAARDAVVSAGTPAERQTALVALQQAGKAANPLAWLKDRLAKLNTFKQRLLQLKSKKLPYPLIAEVAAAGPELGVQLADAILASNIADLTATYGQVQSAAAATAAVAGGISVKGSRDASDILDRGIRAAVAAGNVNPRVEIAFMLDGKTIEASLLRLKRQRGSGG